jgi:putative sugar O-methyltransferase
MKNQEYQGWNIQRDIAENYVNAVNKILSDNDIFSRFRSGIDGYTPILEHLSYYDGIIYYNIIKKKYPHLFLLIDEFKKNDSIGSPLMFYYQEIGNINPTTLRYIKIAGDIQERFGNLNGVDLIEIGAGYGGLVSILSKLFKFNSVRLIDLPNVLLLQEKYLKNFGISPIINLNQENILTKNSLVISNYSWNEMDNKTKNEYLNKIISQSKYTFITTCDPESCSQLIGIQGDKKIEKEPFDNNCMIFTNKKYE